MVAEQMVSWLVFISFSYKDSSESEGSSKLFWMFWPKLTVELRGQKRCVQIKSRVYPRFGYSGSCCALFRLKSNQFIFYTILDLYIGNKIIYCLYTRFFTAAIIGPFNPPYRVIQATFINLLIGFEGLRHKTAILFGQQGVQIFVASYHNPQQLPEFSQPARTWQLFYQSTLRIYNLFKINNFITSCFFTTQNFYSNFLLRQFRQVFFQQNAQKNHQNFGIFFVCSSLLDLNAEQAKELLSQNRFFICPSSALFAKKRGSLCQPINQWAEKFLGPAMIDKGYELASVDVDNTGKAQKLKLQAQKQQLASLQSWLNRSFGEYKVESFSSRITAEIYFSFQISNINQQLDHIVLLIGLSFHSYSQQSYQMASSIDRKSSPEMREINIEIANPHLKNEIKSIQNENKIIKKQNQLLRKQLDSLSNKLDTEIKKKMDEKVKPWHRSADSSYLQLQNAYKQCQIYKKEANFYKKRLENLTSGQQKTVELELCKDYLAAQNKNLKQELKSLRKISKFQQRGLQEMGVQGYLNVVNQNKRLNEEIKKLNRQLDQYRRGSYSVEYQEVQQQNNQKRSHSINTNPSNSKNIKTEPRKSKQKFESLNESTYLDGIVEKNQKDYRKIKFLINQRNKLRQQLAYSKIQLTQKQKQIDNLKNKISSLRKNNRFMQSQLGIKDKDTKDLDQQQLEAKSQSHRKLKQEPAKYRVWSKNKTHSVNDIQPRRQERGSSPLNTYKWNHQNLASKIIEVKVLVHEDGHIKDLNIKYKKGQTKKLNTHNSSKYQSFACKAGQYIKHISGCFSDGYLQCLSLITSEKRQKIFGNSFLLSGSEQQSQKFQFLIDQNQFPGALYGQNDEKGVRKLGCLIMKQ